MTYSNENWLVISTDLKNISQIGSFPQVGMKIAIVETTTFSRCAKCTQNGDLHKPPACPIEQQALFPKGRVGIEPSPTHELYSRGVHEHCPTTKPSSYPHLLSKSGCGEKKSEKATAWNDWKKSENNMFFTDFVG